MLRRESSGARLRASAQFPRREIPSATARAPSQSRSAPDYLYFQFSGVTLRSLGAGSALHWLRAWTPSLCHRTETSYSFNAPITIRDVADAPCFPPQGFPLGCMPNMGEWCVSKTFPLPKYMCTPHG